MRRWPARRRDTNLPQKVEHGRIPLARLDCTQKAYLPKPMDTEAVDDEFCDVAIKSAKHISTPDRHHSRHRASRGGERAHSAEQRDEVAGRGHDQPRPPKAKAISAKMAEAR